MLIRLSIVFGVVGAALLGGCSDPGSPLEGTSSSLNRLVVYYSSESPGWDDPEDNIWDKALAGAIDLGEDGYPFDFSDISGCLLRAVVANDSIFLRAEWYDPVCDLVPNPLVFSFDSLVSPDSTWNWTPTQSGDIWFDQDHFAIIWDMGNNGDEGADCLTMCHATGHPTSEHRMYTTGGGYVDVWQWFSATSDRLFLSRDEYWGGEGRFSDDGDSLVKSNFNSLQLKPFYAHPESPDELFAFLFNDNVVEFDSSLAWALGDTIPAYVLQKNATGSTADVRGFSNYSTNLLYWAVVMARPLDTGNADDIDLSQIARGDSVMVSIAVMNNANSLHSGSKPFYIIF
jgi:hypothetical protein